MIVGRVEVWFRLEMLRGFVYNEEWEAMRGYKERAGGCIRLMTRHVIHNNWIHMDSFVQYYILHIYNYAFHELRISRTNKPAFPLFESAMKPDTQFSTANIRTQTIPL